MFHFLSTLLFPFTFNPSFLSLHPLCNETREKEEERERNRGRKNEKNILARFDIFHLVKTSFEFFFKFFFPRTRLQGKERKQETNCFHEYSTQDEGREKKERKN